MEPMGMYLFHEGINLRLEAWSTSGQRHPTTARLCVKLRVKWLVESPGGGVVNGRSHSIAMPSSVSWAALADDSTCRRISSVFDIITSVADLGVRRRWGEDIASFLRAAMRAARDGGSSGVKVRFALRVLGRRQHLVRSGGAAVNNGARRGVAQPARPPAALEEVKRWRYQPGQDGLLREQRSICIAKFKGGAELAAMPCSHVFHGACLLEWLKTSRLCPLCRYKI